MRPSTPIPASLSISAGSLIVHGITLRFSAWASATSSALTLRQNGDQMAHPAARASRTIELPWSAALSPACQGEAPSGPGRTVFVLLDSIVRQDVAMSG